MTDLRGKTALITGGARGMGRVTAEALAGLGAHVIVADWNGEEGARCCAAIRAGGNGSAEFIYCDVSELDSVRALAATVQARHPQLHLLINNAGITYPLRQANSAGVEMHLAACHLGHFLLTQQLLPTLQASAPARILFVASEGHKACKGLDFEDFNNETLWRGRAVNHAAAFMAYARAKLAMLHTMQALAQQLDGSGVTVNAISPGYFVNTGIHREMRGLFRWGSRLVFGLVGLLRLNTPQKGARTHIWAATSPALDSVSGRYFEHCREKAMSTQASDVEERRRLIAFSQQLTGCTS